MKESTELSQITARYQTVNTIFTFDGSSVQLVLRANPKRWYVRFLSFGQIPSNYPLLPGPPDLPSVTSALGSATQEFKFRDCPSVVSGEWYAGGLFTSGLIITECLYLGDD